MIVWAGTTALKSMYAMLCIEVFVYIQSVGGAPSRCSLDYRDDVRDVSHLLLTAREASTQDWDLRGVLSSTSFGTTVSSSSLSTRNTLHPSRFALLLSCSFLLLDFFATSKSESETSLDQDSSSISSNYAEHSLYSFVDSIRFFTINHQPDLIED